MIDFDHRYPISVGSYEHNDDHACKFRILRVWKQSRTRLSRALEGGGGTERKHFLGFEHDSRGFSTAGLNALLLHTFRPSNLTPLN